MSHKVVPGLTSHDRWPQTRPGTQAVETDMKLNPWYLAALVPVALLAADGAFSAQVAVLGVTLGIFFGTLSLGKAAPGDATSTNPGH